MRKLKKEMLTRDVNICQMNVEKKIMYGNILL